MKRPAFQFYPADWRKDAALQSCSMAAQGLWANLLCVMHECEPYGHLAVNERPMQSVQIARLVGLAQKECERLLAELRDAGVSSTSPEGFLFSRRMVKDEHLRNIRAEAGKLGGNPNLLAKKVNQTSKQTTTPSSSSSSSSSSSVKEKAVPNGTDADGVIPSPVAPKLTDPNEIIFGYGVPLLTAAGSTDKHARSFLGRLRKDYGDAALIDKLRECIKAKPLQPLEWLAKALPPPGAQTPAERTESAIAAENARTTEEARRRLFGNDAQEAINA